MSIQSEKIERRLRRHSRVRSIVSGTAARPRLAVFRANQNIYAQLIDDVNGKTLASSSTLKADTKGTKSEKAALVGQEIAKKALELNVKEVVFDRGGFQYHGRVKALAEAARTAGLTF
jgi:large subunit ribosomal protein L18